MSYVVTTTRVPARRLAAMRQQLPLAELPSRLATVLDHVYAVARRARLPIDGQNVIVYRDGSGGELDTEIGVGVADRSAAADGVVCVETPAGEVAATAHWGEYRRLGAAHHAVIEWCATRGRERAGVRWEIYGHWNDDPAQRRTDVCYLLRPVGDQRAPNA